MSAQGDRLAQDDCAAGERCVPCYDPVSGKLTQACNFGLDSGPSQSAKVFAECCGDVGRCVPNQRVPADQRAQLGQDACAGSELCVPTAALSVHFVPQTCEVSAIGAEGRCLPDCLPAVAQIEQFVVRDGCPEHHACAPCYDPRNGEATGACSLADDPGPTAPPTELPQCCGQIGRCVPGDWVPSSLRDRLGVDSCETKGMLCAPAEALSGNEYAPQTCTTSALGAEGRCFPECLLTTSPFAQELTRDGCPAAYACAPCFDPRNGEPTGACSLPGDSGAARPPTRLQDCCGGAGECVPEAWVPPDERGLLGREQCTAQAQLCVAPKLLVSDPTGFVAASCHDPVTASEGRCFPRCLQAVAAQADLLRRAECADQELCVPCFDPVTGASTGACRVGADPGPAEAGVVFEACCRSSGPAAGTCVPSELVPAGVSGLIRETCSDPESVCVPRELAADPKSHLASCSSLLGAAGACVPACLIDAVQTLVLPQDSCGSGELCAPCSQMGSACAP